MPPLPESQISRNGKKINSKQNYLRACCGCQFISDHEITYQGCYSWVVNLVKIMLVRGIGISDISTVLKISIIKVLKVLKSDTYKIKPKESHYDCLEIDEFWTYVRKKKNKVWLIYAYHRESGEIIAYVWRKRDLKTAQKLRKHIKRLGISCERIGTDHWDNFLVTFGEEGHLVWKQYTVGIEGNNCRLRHRIRRVFRRTCCFSKKGPVTISG